MQPLIAPIFNLQPPNFSLATLHAQPAVSILLQLQVDIVE